MTALFKDTNGRWLTQALFVETNDALKYAPVFTLKEDDDGAYLSLKRKYLEYKDPTEWHFANKMFGSYECWENLCESPFFKPYVAQWRKELALVLKHDDFAVAKNIQVTGDPGQQLQATKFLSERKWEDKQMPARGRPVKNKPEDTGRAATLRGILASVK